MKFARCAAAALIAVAAMTATLAPVPARAARSILIPAQRPDSLIPPRHIYAVTTDGTLLLYIDNSTDTDVDWIATEVPAPPLPGVNWASFEKVFAGGDGVIYAIDIFGNLYYFRLLDPGRNHVEMSWSQDSNTPIGLGFAGTSYPVIVGMSRLGFTGGTPDRASSMLIRDGALWLQAFDTTTTYYQHGWLTGGLVAGGEWSNGGDGYVVAPPQGAPTPPECGSCPIIFEGGNGLTYGVAADGTLLRYRIRPYVGPLDSITDDWVNGGVGLPIGTGWNGFKFLFASPGEYFIEGYVSTAQLAPDGTETISPMSLTPGDSVRVRVSTFSPAYRVRLMRLQRHTDDDATAPSGLIDGVTVGAKRKARAKRGLNFKKPFDFAMHANGAAWSAEGRDRKLSRRARSGIYGAELTTPSGGRYVAPFVVKPRPGTPLGNIAVIANVSTWQAYNMWGGGSRYHNYAYAAAEEDLGQPPNYEISYERPLLETDPVAGSPGTIGLVNRDTRAFSHLVRSEVWVTSWLDGLASLDHKYAYDVYSDVDLDVGIAALSQYSAILIDTHPEYWSDKMRDHLGEYLASGGHLVYLAGNGLYDRITLSGSSTMRIAHGVGGSNCKGGANSVNPCAARDLFRFPSAAYPDGRSERAVLGVTYETYGGYLGIVSSYGFTTQVSHPFFTAGGLGIGAQLGDIPGLNHNMKATGLEADSWTPDCRDFPNGVCTTSHSTKVGTVLAEAANGAGMVYHTTGIGSGWVFSAGAIPVAGVLAIDPTFQAVVKSALDSAIAGVAP